MNIFRISMNGCEFFKEFDTLNELKNFFTKEGYPYVHLRILDQYDGSIGNKKLKISNMNEDDFQWALGNSELGQRDIKAMKN